MYLNYKLNTGKLYKENIITIDLLGGVKTPWRTR